MENLRKNDKAKINFEKEDNLNISNRNDSCNKLIFVKKQIFIKPRRN